MTAIANQPESPASVATPKPPKPQFPTTVGMRVMWYMNADKSYGGEVGCVTVTTPNDGPVEIRGLGGNGVNVHKNVYHCDHFELTARTDKKARYGGWDYLPGELTPHEVAELRELLLESKTRPSKEKEKSK